MGRDQTSRERRARLPGVDELFRPTAPDPVEPSTTPRDADDADPAGDGGGDAHGRERGALERLADALATGRMGRPAVETAELSPGTGAVISWMAGCLGAHHVAVMDGSGGEAAWWALRGTPAGGTVTLLGVDERDVDDVRDLLRTDPGEAHARVIPGPASEVLERLSDGAYELVVICGARDGERDLHQHAVRLLAPDGVVMLLDVEPDGAVPGDQAPLPGLVRDVVEDPRLRTAVLAISGGAILARLLA